MNIAIIGYGKMGQTIEKIAQSRGHHIALVLDETPSPEDLKTVEVAIEFSQPEAAVRNIKVCLENNVRVVSGTTGWLANLEAMQTLCLTKQSAFIYASNYSIGVNIFFKLNELLAQMMAKHLDTYHPKIKEIHHNQKLDAPSGTAITLAEGIIKNTSYDNWSLYPDNNPTDLSIKSKRIGVIPGTHCISYDSIVDSIELKHTAHTREGFALGAVIAAEWLADKTGNFTMQDVLSLEN